MRFERQFDGSLVTIDEPTLLGVGGEARVYGIKEASGLAAKIYRDPTPERAAKLAVMLASPPEDPMKAEGQPLIAWPVDVLRATDGKKDVVGFLMPRVHGAKPVSDYLNPRERRRQCPGFNYHYLVRTARNMAAAVQALHARGYVVGDLKSSNIYVSVQALVTLLDTDSFQVADDREGKLYRCGVGTPEYTAPEVLAQLRRGRRYQEIQRTVEQDSFALGTLIFELLMEGTRPFDGVFGGADEPPAYEQRIEGGHFPHPKGRSGMCRPKPGAPVFGMLHPRVQELFLECFVEGHKVPEARPDGRRWQQALDEVEAELVPCAVNASHRYWVNGGGCPWCERAVLLGGRDPFPAMRQPVKPPPLPQKPPPLSQKPPPLPPQAAVVPVGESKAAGAVRGLGGWWLSPSVMGACQGMALAAALLGLFMVTSGVFRENRSATNHELPANPNPNGLVWIKPGTFTMGTAPEDKAHDEDEEPPTQVILSRGFWMGKCEVTQAEYEELMGQNPTEGRHGPELPVADVSWEEATNYCARLTERERQAGRLPPSFIYRLPTEAEWEYGARAGTTTKYFFGDDSAALGEYAWYDANSQGQAHPVGQKRPNPWGLHDIYGNVWEWCFGGGGAFYPGGNMLDPHGSLSGTNNIVRGGYCGSMPRHLRSAYRHRSKIGSVGFRVALAKEIVQHPESDYVVALRKAAELGSAVAERNLGETYKVGAEVARDYQEAVVWYRKAAEHGDVYAQWRLGTMYEYGRGVARDDHQAVAWYRKAADQGHAKAQFNLGWMYEEGRGMARDDQQAVAWFRKAAEQGNAAAQCELGIMYEDGRGVARDDHQALAWYRKAAEQGNADAQFNLGVMYENGRGVARDHQQAVAWYRKAAEQGNADAQNNLGLMCSNGAGVARDLQQAVAWFRKAAEQGNANAQNNLGLMCSNGAGVARDLQQAVAWFRKAAEQGNADAQFNLASMYANGRGVAQDDQQSLVWLRKAAENGSIQAQRLMGTAHAKGLGFVRDDRQAAVWFWKAAEQGDAIAQRSLGIFYYGGTGVSRELEQAYKWLSLAGRQGDKDAAEHLAKVRTWMSPQQIAAGEKLVAEHLRSHENAP